MFSLPAINTIRKAKRSVDVFRGYNHNLVIEENEFYDMRNMSSDLYPVLAPRKQRGTYQLATSGTHQLNGIIGKDALCYVDGGTLYINNLPHAISLENSKKTLVSMGAYIIIMPDKKYVNTADLSDYGDIEAKAPSAQSATFSLCRLDGTPYSNVLVQASEPADHTASWIDTSESTHVLKQWSTSQEAWVSIITTYVKIEQTNVGKNFERGDGVVLSGITASGLTDLNTNVVIQEKGDNFIVVIGILDGASVTQNTGVSVERNMPAMDFVIECENRLWGCRYGEANDGSIVNEIYASKLGDFKNWSVFNGISTDSYAVSVGTDGAFTGAIAHLGYPLFFKEDCLHKIYGNYPSNYQMQTTTVRGVQKGCERSLAIVNEILYYKSKTGIMAYDGSLPDEISYVLGDVAYSNAVAGSINNKYYVSMSLLSGLYFLFVYDASKKMWHREDETRVDQFATRRGELYYIDHDTQTIKTVNGSESRDIAPIKWYAESGIITYSTMDKKNIIRMEVRLSADVGTRVRFSVEYDSSGEFAHVGTITANRLGSFTMPIRTKMCDHFKLRIDGIGEAKIFAITKVVSEGGRRK